MVPVPELTAMRRNEEAKLAVDSQTHAAPEYFQQVTSEGVFRGTIN